MRRQLFISTSGTVIIIDKPKRKLDFDGMKRLLQFKQNTLLHGLELDDNQTMIVDAYAEENNQPENHTATILARVRGAIPVEAYLLGNAIVMNKENITL